MTLIYDVLKPYGVDDLADFDALLKNDEFYPFSKDGRVIDEIAVKFFLKLGYVFDVDNGHWYLLNRDALYYEIREERVYSDIIIFLDHFAKRNGFNFYPNNTKSIFERLKNVSYYYLDRKREHFLNEHDDYDVGYGNLPLIPVLNGVFNPNTTELLPHSAYILNHDVLGFNFKKLSWDDIRYCDTWDAYAGILPDEETLRYFLWWVGLVLFSNYLPRVILFLYGMPKTGKTTLSLGLSDILTKKRFITFDNEMTKSKHFTSLFLGKDLVICDEMSSNNGLWDDSTFKKLAGGGSTLTIEPKYKQAYNVDVHCKLMLMGNSYPPVAIDEAIIDRLAIIRCDKVQHQSIVGRIRSEEGLNWLFNAAYHFYVEEHPHTAVDDLSQLKTKSMREELEFYRNTDNFIFWIRECLDIDIDKETVQNRLLKQPCIDVFNNYKSYSEETGSKPLSQKSFNARLRLEYGLIGGPVRNPQLKDGVFRGYKLSDDEGVVY